MRDIGLKRAAVRHSVLTVTIALGMAIGDVGFASEHAPAAETIETESDAAPDAKIRGFELGEYKIRAYYPVEAQKSTVRFVLYGVVATESFAEAQRVVDARRHKLRDEVITVTRMAPLALFDEPGLTSFRRRILVRLRRTLPELPIDDVLVSDFQLTVNSL